MIAYEIKDSHSNITNIMQILNWKSEIVLYGNSFPHEHLYTLHEYSHRLKEDCTPKSSLSYLKEDLK